LSSSSKRPGNHALRMGRVSIPGQIYHLTARVADGNCEFANPMLAFAACRAFHAVGSATDARLLAWALMPDHAHWLIELGVRDDLSTVAARLKSSSAGACNEASAYVKATSIWQAGFYDRAIRRDEDVLRVARYIVANPIRARLVASVGDYPWWNAVWI
jgi:putative transposase